MGICFFTIVFFVLAWRFVSCVLLSLFGQCLCINLKKDRSYLGQNGIFNTVEFMICGAFSLGLLGYCGYYCIIAIDEKVRQGNQREAMHKLMI